MVCYSKILLGERQSKPYGEFLNSLVQTNFYNANEEKITIKRLAADFKSDSTKVTKWIREIYDDIFELNYDKPDLFQKAGIRVALYLKHFD